MQIVNQKICILCFHILTDKKKGDENKVHTKIKMISREKKKVRL